MTLKRISDNAAARPVVSKPLFRLLYVEDEQENWDVAAVHLRDRYELVRATSAAEAFAALAQKPFHAILMDIQLSGSELDGIEITRVLRGKPSRTPPAYAERVHALYTPIIFMTAYTARYSLEELRRNGGDALVSKPVNFDVLQNVLTELIVKGKS